MKFQVDKKNVQLNVQISNNVPRMIFSDPKRYKQILLNLMGNAAKFTFKGAINLIISLDGCRKQLITTVADTGIGIASQDLDKLFKFFGNITRSKDINKGGMGLGLTISKMIVH